MEWRRQRGKVETWEAIALIQAKDNAGSAQGGGPGKGEKQGYGVEVVGSGRGVK